MTRFAGIPRWMAIGIVAVTIAIAVGGVYVSRNLGRWSLGVMGVPDVDTYQKVVLRVQQGENYYDAIHQELNRLQGSRGRSMFEYRQPTYAWLLAALPD